MGKARYSDDFKRDAIQQITDVDIPQRRFRGVWVSVVIRFMLGGSAI